MDSQPLSPREKIFLFVLAFLVVVPVIFLEMTSSPQKSLSEKSQEALGALVEVLPIVPQLEGTSHRLVFRCETSSGKRLSGVPVTLILDGNQTGVCQDGVVSFRVRYPKGTRRAKLVSGKYSKLLYLEGLPIVDFKLPMAKAYTLGDNVTFRVIGWSKDGQKKEIPLLVNGQKSIVFKRLGLQNLKLSYENIEKPFSVEVYEGEAVSLQAPKEVKTIVGETLSLVCQAKNKNGFSIEGFSYSWKGPKLGILSNEGFLRAVKPGKSTIVVSAPPLSQEVSILVSPADIKDLYFKMGKLEVAAGSSVSLSVEGLDSYGNHLPLKKVDFSILAPLGDFEGNVFHAKKTGSSVIFAHYGNFLASLPVTVLPGPPVALRILSPRTAIAGESLALDAAGVDSAGNLVSLEVSFRKISGPGVLRKNQLFSKRAGETCLQAFSSSLASRFCVEVLPSALDHVDITGPGTVRAGEVRHFFLLGRDRFGNPVQVVPAWRVLSGEADVDPQGYFSSRKAGVVVIEGFSFNGKSKRLLSSRKKIFVTPSTPQYFDPLFLEATAGEPLEKFPKIFDAYGNVLEAAPKLKSAGLERDGKHAVRKAGSYPLVVSFGKLRAEGRLEVRPAEASGLEIRVPEKIKVGECVSIALEAHDKYGNAFSIPTSEWTARVSSPAAELHQNALCGKKPGRVTVISLFKGKKTQANLTVMSSGADKISGPSEIVGKAGETQELSFKCLGPSGAAVQCSLKYSLMSAVAEVSGKKIVFLSPGQAVLKIEAGTPRRLLLKYVKVKVFAGKPVKLFSSKSFLSGRVLDLLETGVVSQDKFGFRRSLENVKASVQPKSLGSFLSPAVFVPKKAGKGFLVFRDSSKTLRIPIEVRPGGLAKIKIEPFPKKLRMVAGESISFSVEGFDANGNQVEKLPKAEIFTVPFLGTAKGETFLAERAGSGKLFVKVGSVVRSTPLEVKAGKVVQLLLTPIKADVFAGEPFVLQVDPMDAFGNVVNKKVTVTAPKDVLVERLKTPRSFLVKPVRAGNKILYIREPVSGCASSLTLTVEPID